MILAWSELTADQLAFLDNHLSDIAEGLSFQPAMIGERCFIATSFTNMTTEDFAEILPNDDSYLWLVKFPPHRMEEQRLMTTFMILMTEAIDVPGLRGRQLAEQIENEINELPERYSLARSTLINITQYHRIGLRHRQLVINARFALRVDAHYDEHGTFPATLTDVLDDDLTDVPLGLFSEKPLVYRHGDEGFVIYDIGGNQIDDGGDGKVDSQEWNKFEVQYPTASVSEGDEKSLQ